MNHIYCKQTIISFSSIKKKIWKSFAVLHRANMCFLTHLIYHFKLEKILNDEFIWIENEMILLITIRITIPQTFW